MKHIPDLRELENFIIYSGGCAYDKQTSTVFPDDSDKGGGVE